MCLVPVVFTNIKSEYSIFYISLHQFLDRRIFEKKQSVGRSQLSEDLCHQLAECIRHICKETNDIEDSFGLHYNYIYPYHQERTRKETECTVNRRKLTCQGLWILWWPRADILYHTIDALLFWDGFHRTVLHSSEIKVDHHRHYEWIFCFIFT